MRIELIYSPGCRKCAQAREALREAALRTAPEARWCELNVLEELDYAVSLGVFTLPVIAIDGKLVFKSLPTPAVLEAELRQRLLSA